MKMVTCSHGDEADDDGTLSVYILPEREDVCFSGASCCPWPCLGMYYTYMDDSIMPSSRLNGGRTLERPVNLGFI